MNRNLIQMLALLVAIALMTAFLQYGRHRQALREWQQCKDNEKNLATALEMYSTDCAGRYPTDPKALVPNYLTRLPECPVQGQAYTIQTASVPDVFTITCSGQQHEEAGISELNEPKMTSFQCQPCLFRLATLWAGPAPRNGSVQSPTNCFVA